MFNLGNIVYHDDLVFSDNTKDIKNKRPSLVLFTIEHGNDTYICSCPLTTSIKSFNKNPDRYTMVTESVYEYKKISFAKICDINIYSSKTTHNTGISLSEIEATRILQKIMSSITKINLKRANSTECINLKRFLTYFSMFYQEDNESKHSYKQKKQRRNKL